jgi:hypothetical protein
MTTEDTVVDVSQDWLQGLFHSEALHARHGSELTLVAWTTVRSAAKCGLSEETGTTSPRLA